MTIQLGTAEILLGAFGLFAFLVVLVLFARRRGVEKTSVSVATITPDEAVRERNMRSDFWETEAEGSWRDRFKEALRDVQELVGEVTVLRRETLDLKMELYDCNKQLEECAKRAAKLSKMLRANDPEK